MSGIPRTDVELLQCAPSVDITMLQDAKDNMIAQDFGEYCLCTSMSKSWININVYIYFFDIKLISSDRSIQATFGRFYGWLPGHLHYKYIHNKNTGDWSIIWVACYSKKWLFVRVKIWSLAIVKVWSLAM